MVEVSSSGKPKMRDAQVLTDDLYYNDQETNTKFKNTAVSVIINPKLMCLQIQTDKMIDTGVGGDDEDDQYYEDEDKPRRANQPP